MCAKSKTKIDAENDELLKAAASKEGATKKTAAKKTEET